MDCAPADAAAAGGVMADGPTRVAFYPGCALAGHPSRRATGALGKALGLELVELAGWTCCGAAGTGVTDPQMRTHLAARNLAKTEEMGFDMLMVPCNRCHCNLTAAERDLAQTPATAAAHARIAAGLGQPAYTPGRVETLHALDWLKRAIGTQDLAFRMQGSLKGLKIANYYGCMSGEARPVPGFGGGSPGEDGGCGPHRMAELLAATGAEIVDFPLRTACCGGPQAMSDSETATQLVLNILTTAEACGAAVIATQCPTCHSSLEIQQLRAARRGGRKTRVKILYVTQVLGLALGLSPQQLGLPEEMADAEPPLQRKELG